MKTRLILSFLLVVAVLALIGLGVYELIQLNPNKHREQITRLVEARTNLKLKLGLIFPIVYPGIGFQIKEVEVWLPDPERTQPELFKAESVKAILDLKELLQFRRIRIKEVILNQPEFYLELGPKEKARFQNLIKPKTEEQKQKEIEAKKTFSHQIFNYFLNRFALEITPESLLETDRVLIFKASGKVYDKRDKPKKLRAPMEFGNIELGIIRAEEKNSFSFWLSGDHPYNQGGVTPLRFEGKGKMFLSLKPFSLRANFDEAKWGDNPFSRMSVELAQKEGKLQFSGVLAGRLNLHQARVLLSWAPIKYHPKQDQFPFWGEAEYQYHFQPGENNWEKFVNVDQAVIRNFKIILYDPKGRPGKILEPVVLGNAKIEIKGLQGEKPGELRIEFPFPYQESSRSLEKLKPFPVVLEGKLRMKRNFATIEFNSEKGMLGSNSVDLLKVLFTRSGGKFSLSSSINLKVNELSEFQPILHWSPIKLSPVVKWMNFSGKARIILDFRYPGSGTDKFWYQGTARLREVVFEPGMIIYPVEKINGVLNISPSEISLPYQWLSISGMPIQSDFVYKRDTKDNRPRIKLKSNVDELDLSKLFFSRSRKYGTRLEIGEPLGPVSSIWEGEITGNRVKYKKFTASSVKGKWRYKDRIVTFPNLTLKYKNGWFQNGGTWLDLRRARTAEFHFRGHFEEFKFKDIMDELFGYDFFVDGKATGEGYLSGKFVDGKLEKNSLNGYFKLVIREGGLLGTNLGTRLLQNMGFKIEPEKTKYPFQKAKVELVFKEGVIYFEDLEFRSEVLEAHCAGKVDLVNETLNLWVAVYPLELLATITKPIPLIGALINQTQESLFGSYAKVSGPWKDYKIDAYAPLLEKVPKTPKAPPFPARPKEGSEKKSEGEESEKE